VEQNIDSLLEKEVSIEAAVQIALLNNRNLQATYEELGIAQADLVQAGLLKNPVFSIERRFSGQAAECDVVQDFFDLFLVPLRKRVAAAAFEAAKLHVGEAVVNLATTVRSAFYTLQETEQLVEMRRSVVQSAEASAEAARALYRAGNITELDLRSEQKSLAQAKLDLALAEERVVEEREQLNTLLGLWGARTRWTMAVRLPELPEPEIAPQGLESLAVSQRLDLASARQDTVLAAQSLGLTGAKTSADEPMTPAPGLPGKDYQPVVVPNGVKLPWKVVNGVKIYHLIAEEVEHEFAPGLKATCWGYNGAVHGPVIEAVEGDRVRIYVTNRLPAATSVHWHGVILPSGMDGVAGLSQRAIPPGETFKYEFTLHQYGTQIYHSHHDEMTQIGLGTTGLFVIHPRTRPDPPIDRDFAIMLHEWRIDVGTSRPNPNEMTDFNVLTFNGRAFPGTEPLVAKVGDRVRIRIGNVNAMDHHPIHLHGHSFKVVETDGGQIPELAQWPETTVLVPVGSSRTVEFIARPGDWALHCHMTHHVMNQMGHKFPNMIGVKPGALDEKVGQLLPEYMTMGRTGMGDMGDMGMAVPKNSIPMVGGKGPFGSITMGGMFTILKVREQLSSYDDPGWYDNPAGTVAERASSEDLRADGIIAGRR